MTEDARDAQFRGFAKLEFDDVYWMFNNLFIEQSDCDYEKAEKTGRDIQVYLSRRAYDLAQHTVGYCLEYLHECGFEISGSMNGRVQPSIPDMTTWPEVPE